MMTKFVAPTRQYSVGEAVLFGSLCLECEEGFMSEIISLDPASLLPSTWHALIYPVYALPAWIYIGLGIDAGIGRCLVRRWNVVLSLCLALTFAVLFCGFRFGMSAAERESQELLSWFIEGFALWAVLFAIPFVAWMLRRKRETPLVRDGALPS